jgi:hypothetical protein
MYVPADGDLNKEFCFICERVVKLSKILYDVIVINYGEPVNYPGVKQITAQLSERKLWEEAANMSDTQMFWLIDSNVTMLNSFDLTMNIPLWDTCYIHHWPDDLLLLPKNYDFTGEINYKYHKSLSCIRERSSHVEITCDTFFLSYNEHNADTNFDRVKQLRPNTKRIHGVTGIFNAHKAAAEKAAADAIAATKAAAEKAAADAKAAAELKAAQDRATAEAAAAAALKAAQELTDLKAKAAAELKIKQDDENYKKNKFYLKLIKFSMFILLILNLNFDNFKYFLFLIFLIVAYKF